MTPLIIKGVPGIFPKTHTIYTSPSLKLWSIFQALIFPMPSPTWGSHLTIISDVNVIVLRRFIFSDWLDNYLCSLQDFWSWCVQPWNPIITWFMILSTWLKLVRQSSITWLCFCSMVYLWYLWWYRRLRLGIGSPLQVHPRWTYSS